MSKRTTTKQRRVVEGRAVITGDMIVLGLAAEVGAEACRRGDPIEKNPYTVKDPDPDLAYAWNLGWREAFDTWVTREVGR